MRAAVALLVIFQAGPLLAQPTTEDLLQAAHCIGIYDGLDAVPTSHIKADPNQQKRRDRVFDLLLGLPYSPDDAAMEQARDEGKSKGMQPPDPFAPIESIMAESADCFDLLYQLGLIPLLYPN